MYRSLHGQIPLLTSMAKFVLMAEGRCCGNLLPLADHNKDWGLIMGHTLVSSQQLDQANYDLLNEKENVTKSFKITKL